MEFRAFKKEDYTVYASWFADPWLNQALGPMDEEWLEYILQDNSGTQYAIFIANEMVAVLGVVWAPSKEAYHLISDLAIRPEKRRQGIAFKVLKALLELSDLPPAKGWLTYVDEHNPKALRFMEKMNWTIQEKIPMMTFVYTY